MALTVNLFLCIFPEVPGRTFFPNLSKLLTFAVAPLVLTPFVRHQAKALPSHWGGGPDLPREWFRAVTPEALRPGPQLATALYYY